MGTDFVDFFDAGIQVKISLESRLNHLKKMFAFFLTAILSGLRNCFFYSAAHLLFLITVFLCFWIFYYQTSFTSYINILYQISDPFFSFIFSISFSLLYFQSRSCNGFTPLCLCSFLSFLGSSRHQPTI